MVDKEIGNIKVLWISNVPPIPTRQSIGYSGGGWLAGAFESIKDNETLELYMAFPVCREQRCLEGENGKIKYFGFYVPVLLKIIKIKPLQRIYLKRRLSAIINKINPDILHIFGTESIHSLVAIECFAKPENTIIHIQGLVSIIAKHCLSGFPFLARHALVFSSIVHSTLYGQFKRFRKAGRDEVAAIKQVSYVMGRTDWDKACTRAVNASIEYVHCGETLRNTFYEKGSRWEYEKCIKHSIYFSQSSSQVKGLHLVLPVLPELIEQYSDVHLYIGGDSPIGENNLNGKLRRSPLGWYLKHQIKKYKLWNYITFLGVQNEQQVVQNLKNAHVFLSASLIENSPNSVGEALVVGTPVVSSDVGGVKDFIKHGENGYIYPVDEPYMIPYYIGKIFDDTKLAERFSTAGRKIGREKYSGEENGEIIISTYKKMIGNL